MTKYIKERFGVANTSQNNNNVGINITPEKKKEKLSSLGKNGNGATGLVDVRETIAQDFKTIDYL